MNQSEVSKTTWYSIALMAVTSIHHAYGAVLYGTPWRLHVLMISVPVIILTVILSRLLQRPGSRINTIVFWLFLVLTIVPSIGLIGVFEGLYNHVLKNTMYFGGASHATLQSLFPAPTYEMPNDLIFEITGVLQGFIVIPLIVQVIKLISGMFISRQSI